MKVVEANEQNDHLSTEMDYESQLLEIERLRNDYAEKGEYENAQACTGKIKEIKESIQEKKKRDLEYHQVTEIDNLEYGYKQEIERVNNNWDIKIGEFQEKSQKAEDNLNERQMSEMESLYAALEQKLDQRFKNSKEYLILEKQEIQLVKFQRFDEAVIVKKKKETQRQKDVDKWNKEKNEKIRNQAIAKSNKHLNEKQSFKKKYEIELELLKKQKNDDVSKIQKKYQNKKLELDLQQRNERMLSEKEYLSKIGRVKRINNLNTTEAGYHSRSHTQNIESKAKIDDRYNANKGEYNEEDEEDGNHVDNYNHNEEMAIHEDNYNHHEEEAIHEDNYNHHEEEGEEAIHEDNYNHHEEEGEKAIHEDNFNHHEEEGKGEAIHEDNYNHQEEEAISEGHDQQQEGEGEEEEQQQQEGKDEEGQEANNEDNDNQQQQEEEGEGEGEEGEGEGEEREGEEGEGEEGNHEDNDNNDENYEHNDNNENNNNNNNNEEEEEEEEEQQEDDS